MSFDFKKEFKELYKPGKEPEIIEVPKMNFLAVQGKGDPNEVNGEYQRAINLLYPVAYTIRMSYKSDRQIPGYFKYVVPPLEGFWWQDGVKGVNLQRKDAFSWISVIRLPDFVSNDDVEWAKKEVIRKKKLDCSAVKFCTIDEGLSVQIMHLGPFDDEHFSVAKMDEFIANEGYEKDFTYTRHHHEIYLSDVRKVEPEKYKTIIRHPVRKKNV